MTQSLKTPPTSVPVEPPTTSDWERDAKAWNVPRQRPDTSTTDSAPRGTRDETLDWKSFVATFFPDTRRHNFNAIMAYSDYRRSLRASGHSEQSRR